MVQTDLMSDNFCVQNDAAAPYFWILDPIQRGGPQHVQYNFGETGLFTGVGLQTPAPFIDISSNLQNYNTVLSLCQPPVLSQSKDAINPNNNNIIVQGGIGSGVPITSDVAPIKEPFQDTSKTYNETSSEIKKSFTPESLDANTFLLTDYTRRKGAANDYSAVDWLGGFLGTSNNLFTDPQDKTYIIERMWLERGGLDSNQLIKDTWNNKKGPFVPKTGGRQEPTCLKLKHPYSAQYWSTFGFPTDSNGNIINSKQSKHFDALDVASAGISSPLLDQNNKKAFNNDAMYSNGGCNSVSQVKNQMCSNKPNNMTVSTIPPSGLL